MYHSVLVPMDLSDINHCDILMKNAMHLVSKKNAHKALIYICTVIPDIKSMGIVYQQLEDHLGSDFYDKNVSDAKKKLDEISCEYSNNNIEIHCRVEQGSVYQNIIDLSDELKVSCIIMHAHRPELKDYLLGPNSAKVVRHSNVSVLVVRD